MLSAKFLKMGKGGALAIYEVRGTSSELSNFISNNFKDREPIFKSTIDGKPIKDANGNKVPLYFTSYPLPGKNIWHPLYQVQMGDNAGSWTLDKSELQFESLVAKSQGADLGQAIASELAKKWTASSAPVSSSASNIFDEDEEDDADDDNITAESASEDANMDELQEVASTAKTSKKP
jgi:hypothetical protein